MIVFATPDGWADSQQAVIKTALRHAGILSPNDPEGPNGRLCFVHESEGTSRALPPRPCGLVGLLDN